MNQVVKRISTPLEHHKAGAVLLNFQPANRNLWSPALDEQASLFTDGRLYISDRLKQTVESGHIIDRARQRNSNVQINYVPENQTKELHGFLTQSGTQNEDAMSDKETFRAFLDLTLEADKRGASDLHLYIQGNVLVTMFRVHTVLEAGEQQQAEFGRVLLRSMYYECDQKEQQFNETGPMAGMLNLRKYNLNVSYETARLNWTYNSAGIECVVRFQKPLPAVDLSQMGYRAPHMELFDELLSSTTGTHIFCGPTGSGKSFVQHMLCREQYNLLRGEKKFKGFADPEEFAMPFNQVSINVGNDPQKRQRALLDCFLAEMRMDLDYANFGELRDKATAETLLTFVQSGHFAWASMHAISPDRIIPQLRGLGVTDLSLFETSIISTGIGQRLLPLLCKCAKPLTKSNDVKDKECLSRFEAANIDVSAFKVRNITGCSKCRGGFSGVTPVIEPLKYDEDIMKLYRLGDDHLVKNILREKNTPTFFDDALPKLLEGQVDPHSVERSFNRVTPNSFRTTHSG